VIGGLAALYRLSALTAFPLRAFVARKSIVYINRATSNTAVAVVYIVATCGSLFFSRVTHLIIFGAANLIILITVLAVKSYAFTSL
jgi:hypothetical protein